MGFANAEFREADVFDVSVEYTGKSYGTIVLDPPAFTKSRGKVEAAHCGGIKRSI